MLYALACKNLTLPIVLHSSLPGRFVGRMQYAPTLTAENRVSNKHVFAPAGSFVGRIQYAPTWDNEKRKMNNEKAGYPAKFPGLGEGPFRGREDWPASLMP